MLELARHAHKLDMNLQSLCGNSFSPFAVRMLAKPLGWTDQQHFAKKKMGYISLPSILKAIMFITSYYCVILKMVILNDAIKTIQNGVFPFSFNRNNILFLLKKKQKKRVKKRFF